MHACMHGEGIESFNLTLVLPNSQPISADIVSPSSVTVIIIDDDCTWVGCHTLHALLL